MPLPRSLAGQLALLLVAALVAAQALGFALFAQERGTAYREAYREGVAARLVSLIRLIEDSPAELHERIAATASTAFLRVSLGEAAGVAENAGSGAEAVAARLASALARPAGGARGAGRRPRAGGRAGSPSPAGRPRSGVHPQAAGRSGPLAGGAQATQALDEHRVVRLGVGTVDDAPEQLVIPRRGDAQFGADGLFFGPGVPSPLGLEGEDRAVTVGQGHTLTLTPRPRPTPRTRRADRRRPARRRRDRVRSRATTTIRSADATHRAIPAGRS